MAGLAYRDKATEPHINGRGDADNDEDDDDEIDETGYKAVKDAVLFAIDVSKSMLTKPQNSDPKKPDTALCPTIAALQCAYALMQQRIISSPNDMMGVLLFGTEKSKSHAADDENGRGALQYPHCYLLTDLDVPAAADVKQLRNMVQDEDEAADLLQPSKEEVSMANVLFCANQIFTTKAPNFSSRRLFLVTDNDFPHSSNRDARNSAAVRAKDLYDLGVAIELFPISHPDRGYTFDRSKFYNDIVYSATPTDPDAPAPVMTDVKPVNAGSKDGISLLQSLLSSISSRATPRRAIFSNVPFEIGPGFKIGVKGYIILKKQEPRRTSYIYLPPDGERAQIATGHTGLMAEGMGKAVEKKEIRRAFKFGGETVSFSDEEMSKLRNFGEPVIRIIGFKPMDLLPIWANTKHNTFIYPSEEHFVGSTRVFAALHKKLLSDNKFALTWFIPRRNAVPVLAAVFPSAERTNDEGEQTMPAGMWVKPLPFADDIRQPPSNTNLVRAPDAVIDAMRTVIQQLQLPKAIYDPQRYPNPSLQWFYKILQAMALDEDIPEVDPAKDDKTLPRWRQIHKRAGPYVVAWGEELDKQFQAWEQANKGRAISTASGAAKRSKPASSSLSSGPNTKKIKLEESSLAGDPNGDDGDSKGISDEEMRSAWKKNTLPGYKVADLKQWLLVRGSLGKGVSKKVDLVDAVGAYFETRLERR